jgi:hypothetical protein
MRGKLALLGVAVVATLSGCSALTGGTTGATATTAPTPAASGTPSPMQVIAVSTPKAHTGAPALSTTGSSWKTIVTSLTGYGQWLLGNPDPSLVGNIATPGCGQAALLGRQVTGLINSNTYVRTSPPVITQVLGPSAAPANGTVALTVVASRPAEPVLSQAKSGLTVTTIAPYGATALLVTLNKGTDNKWRLCDVTAPDGTEAPLL